MQKWVVLNSFVGVLLGTKATTQHTTKAVQRFREDQQRQNHVHILIDFATSAKKINTIIGDGKRFMAYDIISRIEEAGNTDLLQQLKKAVSVKDKNNGKKHEVWKESFDWKYCETAKFAYQKLLYIHNNPCNGKWNLAADIMKYEHSSARYYISGKHAAYDVVDVEEVMREKNVEEIGVSSL